MPHYDPCDNYDGAFDPKPKPKTPSKRELTRLARAAGAAPWAEIQEHAKTSLVAYGSRIYVDITGGTKATRRRALAAALRVLAGEEG